MKGLLLNYINISIKAKRKRQVKQMAATLESRPVVERTPAPPLTSIDSAVTDYVGSKLLPRDEGIKWTTHEEVGRMLMRLVANGSIVGNTTEIHLEYPLKPGALGLIAGRFAHYYEKVTYNPNEKIVIFSEETTKKC